MADFTTTLNKSLYRGNTTPWKFVYKEDGVVFDITGATMTLTVDSLENPEDPSATAEFQITATLTDAANGAFEFRPSVANMTLDAGTYFYEVSMLDANSYITSIVVGELEITEGIKDV